MSTIEMAMIKALKEAGRLKEHLLEQFDSKKTN